MKISLSLIEVEQAVRDYLRAKGIEVKDNAKIEMLYERDYDDSFLTDVAVQIEGNQK